MWCYRMFTGVGIFAYFGVRRFVGEDQHWQCYRGAQLALEVSLVLGSASVALVQGFTPVALGKTLHSPLFLSMCQIFGPLTPCTCLPAYPHLRSRGPRSLGKGQRPLWLLPSGERHCGVLRPSARSLSGCICRGR